jgi:hypothetical protein
MPAYKVLQCMLSKIKQQVLKRPDDIAIPSITTICIDASSDL